MKKTLLTTLGVVVLATAIAPLTSRAAQASPSELLEKGIYTEETKGDVDAAIAIYEQLVAQTQANQALAAQAQLRLGECYLKKNRVTDAAAAFEKLIKDFPNEKAAVAKAREHLPSDIVLGPVTWVDGERLDYTLTLGNGMEIGAMETRADLLESGKVWRVGRRMSGGAENVSRVEVDAATFRPITSYWKHTLLGEFSAAFRSGEIEIQKAGSTDTTKIHPEKVVFDNEECFHLPRRLPLQLGYKTTIPVITTMAGGAVIPLGCEVVKKETLEVPAGKFDCFKMQLSIGQTLWFSDDAHRYLVRFEAGGATGNLTAITTRKAGEPVTFRDEALGLSFTAPAEWFIHRFGKNQPGKQVLIRTYDPNGDATDGGIRLFPSETLPAAARQSSRAWAELHLAEIKAVKIRPASWQNVSVSGRLGAACVADFTDGDKAQVQYLVHAIGPKYSELFVISSAPEKFEALKKAFESILATYRTTK